MTPAHAPDGWPICRKCKQLSREHRVEHEPEGNPCQLCGLPKSQHRKRSRKFKSGAAKRGPSVFWGIDGEGTGRDPHRYVMLAAVSEDGSQRRCLEGADLGTAECLDFILGSPPNARLFAYSFVYDLTMILRDLPEETIYLLFHEELRQRSGKAQRLGPTPVEWLGYELNLQRTKFTVEKNGKRVVIWDIWKFFQGKFTAALESWQIGTKEELERMARMKDMRAEFDRLSRDEIREYCYDECSKMAQLARRLVVAHNEAGINLRTFYGAGSSASGMLKLMGITRFTEPEAMSDAVAKGFFGGRFENAIIGKFPGPVWGYDISSAYPYQLCLLPCLEHGTWEYTTSYERMLRARSALVNYALPRTHDSFWAPFPYREAKGNICFPQESGGGWVYKAEFLAGARLFPAVGFKGAWVYECDCACEPFRRIPEFYRQRIRLGKEAAGIVLKLGMNSCYGKLAQSIGVRPPFQCWLWAGMITSGCRAQILDMLGRLSSFDKMLMVATDGIYTSERIVCPTPVDTGTFDLPKPLGGWEEKLCEKGIFAARPGIYFPLEPTADEIKEVRARGIGKGTLLECWETIVDAYERGDKQAHVKNLTRFSGAKTSISVRGRNGDNPIYHRSGVFGQWVKRAVKLSFDPHPKRDGIADDGRYLTLRSVLGESTPYRRAIAGRTKEALELKLAQLEAEEQPDGGDLTEYEL